MDVAEVWMTRRSVSVEHVRIETSWPFHAVRAALEELLPPLNTTFLARLADERVSSRSKGTPIFVAVEGAPTSSHWKVN